MKQNGKVAYIVSRFPKLTETFVLYEMIAMQECGIPLELYPLVREHEPVVHPEARPFMEKAHYQPLLSAPILKANLRMLARKPVEYVKTLATVLKSAWGNLRLFKGTLGIFPKSVYFAEQMQRQGITHIHAHFARHPATAAYIVHRLSGIPYSFTAHGSDIHVDRRMLREKVAKADFVVPISEFNRMVILDECKGQYSEKLEVIHCGVDTREAFQPRRWQPESGSKPTALTCIGTLHEVKGHIYLIESLALLKQAGYTFTCHLIGDGPDRAMLTRAVEEKGLASSVIFHGQKTRAEVLQLLQETDILVTPSVPTSDGRKEGIPTVLMEAMASGVPVVASAISGIPELVEDGRNGFLVPPRDVAGLASALQQLIEDPGLRKHFGAAGRQKVEREFDLHNNAVLLAQHFHLETQS